MISIHDVFTKVSSRAAAPLSSRGKFLLVSLLFVAGINQMYGISVPPSWDFTFPTGNSSTVIIPTSINPKINERNFANGDAVGFFFTRDNAKVSAGYGVWDGNNMSVTVWGDNSETQLKDGFLSNETYTVKIWDGQAGVEYDANVIYSEGNNYYSPNGISELSSLNAVTTVTHNLTINSGWNIISTYVEPENKSMPTIWNDIKDFLKLCKNNIGQSYIPAYNINQIGNWNKYEGYQAYMNQAKTLSITGIQIKPEDTPISLTSGWKIVPYLRNTPMSIVTALATLTNDNALKLAKNNAGQSYIPAYNINQIGNMQPGQGYQMYLTKNTSLTYPANDAAPFINSINPTSVNIGQEMTITGTEFGSTQGTSTVTFNGTTAINYTSWSATEIKVKVPTGTTSGKVYVTVNGQNSNEVDFTISDGTIVMIGTQVWTLKNLDVAYYRNGDPIPQVTDPTEWASLTSGAWCYYNNDASNNATYGKLYNWYAVNDSRGLAPIGYHVPSDAEWTVLTTYLGGTDVAGGKMKETGTTHWLSPNTGATNESGFTALPGGYRESNGNFGALSYYGHWWSATEYDEARAWYKYLLYYSTLIGRNYIGKVLGFSVRCVRDLPPVINTINPTSLKIGEIMTITGTGFGSTKGTSTVTFNGTTAVDYTSWSATEIKVKVPTGTTSGKVYVTVNGQNSNEVDFIIDNTETVTIGTQVWTLKNLDVAYYRNGDPIPQVTDSTEWVNLTTGAWCYYNNDASNNTTYGKLYNWYAVNDQRGLAPSGFHVPSDGEWTTLETYLNNNSQYWCNNNSSYIAKSLASKELWNSYDGTCAIGNNLNANNASGFTALPGGYRLVNEGFINLSSRGSWWSAAENDETYAWGRALLYDTADIGRGYGIKVLGFSVRCVRDLPPVINTINPTSVNIGQEMTITGTEFGSTQGISTVTFNGTIAVDYTSWSATEIKVKVPTGTTSGKVYVTVNGQNSNEVDFIIDNTETVTIGTQVWTLKNLDVAYYRNGDPIPQVTDATQWASLTSGAWCYYNNDASNNSTYGKIYNWYAVNDSRGLAPSGYHVPSDAEWTVLTTYLGGEDVAGGKMKETGTTHWQSPNEGATNSSGFSALPGGYRYNYGSYGYLSYYGYWWSATEYSEASAWPRILFFDGTNVFRNYGNKVLGFSVRCVRDLPPVINTINPTSLKIGEIMTITGTEFGSTQGTSTVTFNGTIAVDYTSWNATEIKVKVPTGTTSGKVFVTVNGQNSNEVDFIIDNPETVTIGTQVWTLKNLDVAYYRNGDPIPQVTDPAEWASLTSGAWCYYNNDPAIGAVYGKLYNWYAVNDSRGLAPSGFHVPSDGEWTVLTTYLGGEDVAGGKMKETGTTHWQSPNEGATNSSGFSALPGGSRYYNVYNFDYLSYNGIWWSTTEYNATVAWNRKLYYNYTGVTRHDGDKVRGFSVRCVRDLPPVINTINPTSLKIGEIMTITGTEFGSTQGTSTVTFNGTTAVDYTSWSATEIKVKVPTGTTSGKVFVTVNGQNSNEVDFIIDNTETVTIGTQVWTLKNLDVAYYRNGDPIPQVTDPTEWASLTSGAWCYYNNDESNNSTYGKLYNWYAVNDSRGLAPIGYHVPSDAEWTTLTTYLGGESVAGGKMKETGTTHWSSPNTGATNESGFTALPGGCRFDYGSYSYLSYHGYWWSATEFNDTRAWYRDLHYNLTGIYSNDYKKVLGHSVRCVRD